MDNIQEKNNGKGVKVLLIILIVLILGLLSLECYKIFVVDKNNNDKKESNVVDNSNKNETNTNKNIPVEDTFAEYTEVFSEKIISYIFTLHNGKVYESIIDKKLDNHWALYHSGYRSKLLSDYNSNAIGLSENKQLSSIKRIKGLTVTGSGSNGVGLLLVTEDGKALIYKFMDENRIVEEAKFLENYKVDDIIDYYAYPNCTIGPEDTNFKTCGGEYNIIDQNGNTQHYVVKKDGSLEKK